MWLAANDVQPHWKPYIQALEKLGADELERCRQEAHRQLRENGVTYNVHSDTDNQPRVWPLDVVPLIIDYQDWQVIEAGLKQRAELLNLILNDIYGPRNLIKSGQLPMELIYSHEGFLRQCDGIQIPGKHQLLVYAADLARGPDRRMWVLSDRTQAPSGAGYALENRTVMNRVLGGLFKENKIARLSNFFQELQGALADLAPQQWAPSPRVVVLTPGPYNETYFEHTYLASYLGYPLVQGDDLTVREGNLALKSLDGLQPVDVVLRRVDDLFCDPLELREDSQLGVAGLLEATRRGNVAIANPLGSSVLENPGLMPFLPGLARSILKEDLILPSAATWWCGQPNERDYVVNHLDELVIKKLSRQPHTRTLFGAQLSRKEKEMLINQIKGQPHLYVGQEQVSFSTTPSLVDDHLEARHAVVRCFLVARKNNYTVMPGGLTRSAPRRGDYMVSNQAGGISKDTWVLTSESQKYTSLWIQPQRLERAFKASYHLPSRAAENLYWVGRYAERAEATARLLRVILTYVNSGELFGEANTVEAKTLPYLLRALTQVTMTYPGFVGKGSRARLTKPIDELRSVTLDSQRVGSLLSNVKAMLRAAYTVRDLWSTDTWRVINDLETPWPSNEELKKVGMPIIQNNLNRLVTTLMAFAGLNSESMTHEAGWLLLDTGRRLERALLTIALIRATLGVRCQEPVCNMLLDSILRTTENVITYRRRYRSYLQIQTVLDLLLIDPTNPRSLIYQLDRLQRHIEKMPRDKAFYRLGEEERLILEATTRLRLSDPAVLTQTDGSSLLLKNLDSFMAYLTDQLSQLSNVITQHYFTHTQVPHQSLSAILPELPPETDEDIKLEVGSKE
ncbi:MAG: circularly permuted type 2 ATP-grasp protein [Anaerolineae bacterium]|nr:circularly permuted type 2 ATP-grasp protein [Anaerolineae bacterium]